MQRRPEPLGGDISGLFFSVIRRVVAAIEDRPPREDEPAHYGGAGQDRGDRVTKEYGDGDGTSEGGEIRHDVVDRGNELLVHDMGDSDEDTTRERRG